MSERYPFRRREFLQLSAASTLGLWLPGRALAAPAPAARPWRPGALKLADGRLQFFGEPYQARGIVYQPTPIGQDPTVSGGPFTAYSDPRIRRRDFPLLRRLGANLIRIYQPRDLLPQFFQDALKAGLYIMLGFPVDSRLDFTADWARRRVLDDFTRFVRAWRGQPSIAMWAIGNGVNGDLRREERAKELKAWHSLANEMAKAAHDVEGGEGRPVVLVSSSTDDIGVPALGSDDTSMPHLDLWGLNYWGASIAPVLEQVKSSKLLLVTEYGRDVLRKGAIPDPNQVPRAWEIVNLWNEIAARPDRAVGGCLFEFSDEWWRAQPGEPVWHDWGGAAGPDLPGGAVNLEWYGLYSVAPDASGVNRRIERKTVKYLTEAWSTVITIGQPAVWIDVPQDRDSVEAVQRVSGHYEGLTPGWEIFLTVKPARTRTLFVQPESSRVRGPKGGWVIPASLGPRQVPRDLELELSTLVARTPEAAAALREAARGGANLPTAGVITNMESVRVKRR
jgi:hypothetical protein